MEKTYNGWTNYATWRVNLEIFDGSNWNDFYIGSFPDSYDLGLALREYAEDLIYQAGGGEGNLAVDYALAFLSDVNWAEIARHLIADCENETDDDETYDQYGVNTKNSFNTPPAQA